MRLDDYQLRSVAEDLEYLGTNWRDGASDPDLRRGSALLRRLLIDGGNGILFDLWHRLGFDGHPVVVAPSLSPQVRSAGNMVILAAAGGATVNGMSVAGVLQSTGPIEEEFSPVGSQLPLLEFLAATSLIVSGEPVTRRELVKYFAHYLGGVHMSPKVMKKEQDMVRRIRRIETIVMQSYILNKDLLHFELLSIGQAVGSAGDFKRLSDEIRSRVA